jgi:hypothetical protein
MSPALERVRGAVDAFRRELASDYLRALAGEPADVARVRSFLVSDEALELLLAEQSSGEATPDELAGLCAQFARARLEHGYRKARRALVTFSAREIASESGKMRAGDALATFLSSRNESERAALLRALDGEFESLAQHIIDARVRADDSLRHLLARLAPPRHADAGPEGGSAKFAEEFLQKSDDLAREALTHVLRHAQLEARHGEAALWALLGHGFGPAFPREGRARRVALDWEPLGLRRLLSSHARVVRSHAGPGVFAHVLTRAVPREILVVPPALETGLAAELVWADGVGRALAFAHASPALPSGLRHASVASVARAVGALAVLRLAEPSFLRRVRGLVRADSEAIARVSAAFALFDARFAAAALLARPLAGGAEALPRAQELAVRALTLPLSPGLAAWSVLRLSPGAAFRAKSQAFGLIFALREQFDEDWFLNPRAAEPLRGAMAQAGHFSVESFAEELGARTDDGLRKLGELF